MRSRLVSFGAIVLLIATTLCSAQKAACPRKDGYQVRPNIRWSTINVVETSHSSLAEAEAACSASSTCLGFSNYNNGFRTARGNIGGLVSDTSACTYWKDTCAVITGYTAYINIAPFTTVPTLVSNVEAACNNNAACTVFTTSPITATNGSGYIGTGYYRDFWRQTFCQYVKNTKAAAACPPKYGYSLTLNTRTLAVTDASYGFASGTLTGGFDEAEAFCKFNPRCTAYDTEGRVMVGGARTQSATGICTYTKDGCPPYAGFIAYTDRTVSNTPTSTDTSKCMSEVYSSCLADPTCTGFDRQRNVWNNQVLSPTVTFTGACTYVRVSGF